MLILLLIHSCFLLNIRVYEDYGLEERYVKQFLNVFDSKEKAEIKILDPKEFPYFELRKDYFGQPEHTNHCIAKIIPHGVDEHVFGLIEMCCPTHEKIKCEACLVSKGKCVESMFREINV